MSEIVTAEELDALPDDTLIEASGDYLNGKGSFTHCWARPVPEFITGGGERLWEVFVYGTPATLTLTRASLIRSARVLYRPDEPQAPADVIEAAAVLSDDDGPATAWYVVADHEAFRACRDEERPLLESVLDRLTYLLDLEAAVTELTPATVTPSRGDMARTLRLEFGSFLAHAPHNPGKFWGMAADAILALFPGCSEAEVKAEALREAAESCAKLRLVRDDSWAILIDPADLCARADEIERGGDRG